MYSISLKSKYYYFFNIKLLHLVFLTCSPKTLVSKTLEYNYKRD